MTADRMFQRGYLAYLLDVEFVRNGGKEWWKSAFVRNDGKEWWKSAVSLHESILETIAA